VKASWTDASRVEGVTFIAAGAKPFVFFAGRPAAQRAADARHRRTFVFFFIEFAIQNNWRFGNVIQESLYDRVKILGRYLQHRSHSRHYGTVLAWFAIKG
jgi:hypothetical protein